MMCRFRVVLRMVKAGVVDTIIKADRTLKWNKAFSGHPGKFRKLFISWFWCRPF